LEIAPSDPEALADAERIVSGELPATFSQWAAPAEPVWFEDAPIAAVCFDDADQPSVVKPHKPYTPAHEAMPSKSGPNVEAVSEIEQFRQPSARACEVERVLPDAGPPDRPVIRIKPTVQIVERESEAAYV
jgi:hypothetical protein